MKSSILALSLILFSCAVATAQVDVYDMTNVNSGETTTTATQSEHVEQLPLQSTEESIESVPEQSLSEPLTQGELWVLNNRTNYRRHELFVSYGTLSMFPIVSTMAEIFTLTIAKVDMLYSGAVNLGYIGYVHRSIGLGVTATWEYGMNPEAANFRSLHHYISVMPTAKFYWFNRKHFGMYSRLALGAAYVVGRYEGELDSWWTPAFQVAAVCVEVGNEFVRGFAEVGCGMQGTAQIGVKFKF